MSMIAKQQRPATMERIGRICLLAVLVAWQLFESGSAFPTNALVGFRRAHHHHDRSCSYQAPLYVGRAPTNEATVACNGNEDYLTRRLGFSQDKLGKTTIRRILALENGVLEERVMWLKKRLNLNNNEIKKMAQSHPGILLNYQPMDNLTPKLDYLQARLLLDDKSLRKIIVGAPCILSSSTKDNLIPKLDYLQEKLRLDGNSLRKIIMVAPNTLGCSIEDNLEPKLDWLQQNLMLSEEKIAKIITRFPTILLYSTTENIEPKLDWLKQRLHLDNELVGRMIYQNPTILGSSIPNKLEPTLDWLQQRLSLTDHQLSQVMQKSPALFGYSVNKNIEPTLGFFIEALGDEGEALTLLRRSPDLFCRSLEKRLKPRLSVARDAGMIINAACLKKIGKYAEKKWHSYTSLHYHSRSGSRGQLSTQ